jgi:hypothetical protein
VDQLDEALEADGHRGGGGGCGMDLNCFFFTRKK